MQTCVRCVVSGRVQGVWFRASTRDQALSLGIRGYANNRPDGRVEVLACGEQAAVDRLRAWLWEGPPHAQVTDVRCESAALPPGLTGFATA
jgi:acylphosphatase